MSKKQSSPEQIQQKPLDEIAPYEFNNRNHSKRQIELIARSIKEFGFNQPIVVDEESVILVGHGRWFAARELGIDEVPVLVRAGLSDTQKRAYRILDNKLQNDSAWAVDNLGLELGWLEDNGLDLESWGLDELQGLLPEGDEFEPAEEEAQSRLDEEKPDYVKCPSCEHVFNGKEHKTKIEN